MTRNEMNKLVCKAYSALDVLNNVDSKQYRERLFDMCCAAEREHRRGWRPDGHQFPTGTSIAAAGRFFTVKYIADSLLGKRWEVKDVLHIRAECIYAQAIVENYQREIRASLVGIELRELVALDYCEWIGSAAA